MTPGEYTQRHTDDQFRLHEDRQRFRAPPLNEDLPRDVTPLVPMTLAEHFAKMDEQNRAEDAYQRNLDRNGIPESPTTYVRLFQ